MPDLIVGLAITAICTTWLLGYALCRAAGKPWPEPTDRLIDGDTWAAINGYGPAVLYGQLDADETVARVLGWTDPFDTTRRQIAALETYQEPA